MAQNSTSEQSKTRAKRRRAAPRQTAPVSEEDALQAALAAYRVALDAITAPDFGSIVTGESKHPPHGWWQEGDIISGWAGDQFVRLDKCGFTSSAMTSIAGAEWLVGGAGGDTFYSGVDPNAPYFLGPASFKAEEQEQEADALLKAARSAEGDSSIWSVRRRFEDSVFSGAVEALGGARALGMAVRDEADLLRAIELGFPASVLASLRGVGFRSGDLEGVIAPRRTLARRKAVGQRLTRVESDAAWRTAHVFSLGARVLRGPETALAWLRRPKAALGDQIPIDLIETGVGAQAVERLLYQLEWGDVA
ncbi:MAG TPA: antitoxin Xre/MbcA/ParS toxin-binding domain-containing protein [Allosphingosinicella sp.]|nr:antitoxin Xre/MbcA/ParS toxin-binding domain-containing protein [Allosphingosinicella sp.]